jgi:hypothetical protein
MFKRIKKEIAKAQAQQMKHKLNPDTPEAKRAARRTGLIMISLSPIFALATALEWEISGGVHMVFPIGTVALFGFGLYSLVTGKMKR